MKETVARKVKVQIYFSAGATLCTPRVHGDKCVNRKSFGSFNVQATCNTK
jgi:hypothetical protein